MRARVCARRRSNDEERAPEHNALLASLTSITYSSDCQRSLREKTR
nr:MAG TPA: hypothetical protein [Caudoviricetes sp.]